MDQANVDQNSDEISFKDIFFQIRAGIKYLRKRWLIILIAAMIGGLLGMMYAIFKKPQYIAVCTFVLDEGSGGGLGEYAGLASLAGIDINGTGGAGMFRGDNILELYKSRLMIEKALLSSAEFDGRKELLIDRYINYNKLRTAWKEKHIDNISFAGDPGKFNRKQDSIITDFVDLFNKKVLNVTKPDKKLNIIYVSVTSHDEPFAKEFADKIVETVNNFYVQTKTKKTYQNVQILQRQADSVKKELNTSISGVASAIDAAPNANPTLLTIRVPSQKKQVDVQASTAIYTEIVKNLEIGKITLRQETPLIQVIDKPVLPLREKKAGEISSTIEGAMLFAFLICFFLIVKKLLLSLLD
jgi:capsular polysaccharide biosynthesis protein